MTAPAIFTLAAVATSIAPPASGGAVEIGPIGQWADYHVFADHRDAPVPQISHRGHTILVEFQ